MAKPLSDRSADVDPWDRNEDSGYGGFDVTCVIGRIDIVPNGEESPHVAAFKLIAQHDARGHFSFPMADGRTCSVAVDWEDAP